MQNTKVQSFKDLIVWQRSHSLILSIYKITKDFPKEELYGLISQIRRAAISITSNIAEGFVRKSKKEKVQFYFIALGSITELANQLLIAKDLRFINIELFNAVDQEIIVISKMLNKLIYSINNS